MGVYILIIVVFLTIFGHCASNDLNILDFLPCSRMLLRLFLLAFTVDLFFGKILQVPFLALLFMVKRDTLAMKDNN